MSDRERIDQGAQDKRATWANHLFFLSESLFPSQKIKRFTKNIWIKSYFCKFKKTSNFLTPSFLQSNVSYGKIAHQRWVTVSELLTKNEQLWGNHSPKMSNLVNRSFTYFLAKNEWFTEKTDEQIPNPGNHK